MKTTLAIASTNRAKYSETFIHQHLELLGDGDMLLCDGYLPTSVSFDRGRSFKPVAEKRLLQLAPPKTPQEALTGLFRRHRPSIVMAEFGPAGVALLPVCQKLDIPLIVHFHGYDVYRSDILNEQGKRYPQLFEYACRIIAVSQHMVGQLKHLGCPESKIERVPNGIDTDLFFPSGGHAENMQLAFCGRFIEKKAPDLLLRSFRKIHERMPETRLVMIGDGELLQGCKRLAVELDIASAVDFPGILPPAEVAAVLQSSRLYAQHSLTTSYGDSEGMPLSIMEAMACALPVVSTRHKGISELIEHGKSGVLVPEGDWQAMADQIIDLLKDTPRLSALGKAARTYVLSKHQKKHNLDRLRTVIMVNAL